MLYEDEIWFKKGGEGVETGAENLVCLLKPLDCPGACRTDVHCADGDYRFSLATLSNITAR